MSELRLTLSNAPDQCRRRPQLSRRESLLHIIGWEISRDRAPHSLGRRRGSSRPAQQVQGPENLGWIVITWGWAMAVMIAVYSVGQFTGAHLDPAVTLGFWVAGVIDGGDVPKYLIGEFVGAFIGAALVLASYWDHFRETEDPGLKLAVFSTGPAIRNYPMNLITPRSSARSCSSMAC